MTYNGFGSGKPTGINFGNDGHDYTLATLFKTSRSNQQAVGARMWIDSSANASNLAVGLAGSLWTVNSTTGYADTKLAQFSAVSASGISNAWFEHNFDTPVNLTANTLYLVAMSVPALIYSAISNFFGSADVAPPSGAAGLVFPRSSASGYNGQFHDGGPGIIAPDSNFNSAFYGVDVTMNDASVTGPKVWSGSAWATKPRKTRTASNTWH